MDFHLRNVEDLTLDAEASADDVLDAVQAATVEPSDDGPEAFSFEASATGEAQATKNGVTGVVWQAGDHTMHIDGKPAPVRITTESVRRTFDKLTSAVQAGDPPGLGTDHYDGLNADNVPVAAELELGEIGETEDFALSDDGEKILLTESELTNPQAQQNAEAIDSMDFSIVGPLRILTDDQGDPRVEDGRILVEAGAFNRIDVVKDGGVNGATVTADMPPVAQTASAAAQAPMEEATAFRTSVQAMAKRTADLDMNSLNDLEIGEDDDASDVLAEAEAVVEAKDDAIRGLTAVAEAAGLDPEDVTDDDQLDDLKAEAEALRDKANAAERLAEAQGQSLEEDGVDAVVDSFTEDLRRDVAEAEAALPGYDTGSDDGPSVDDRVDELAGTDPQKLEAMDGQRAKELLEADEARQKYHKAQASNDGTTDLGGSSGGSGTDDEQEAFAEACMTPRERVAFNDADTDSAFEFLAEANGTEPDPSDFENPGEYQAEAATAGEQ